MNKIQYGRYIVYNDGRVYSLITNKFLKGEITKSGYLSYKLNTERIKAHRLVAKLFLNNGCLDSSEIINHLDGNKLNNHVSNLEITDYYGNNKHARDTGLNNVSLSNSLRWEDEKFREKTSKNISKGTLKAKSNSNENNPRFKYRIFNRGNVITRKDLTKLLHRSQSNIDKLIKECADGKIIPIFEENHITVININKRQSTIETITQDEPCVNNGVEYTSCENPDVEQLGNLQEFVSL